MEGGGLHVSPYATPRLAATAVAHNSAASRGREPSLAPPTPILAGADAGQLSKNIILTEAGKAAWYDSSGNVIDAYIIGIAGGSASGKTSVARAIIKALPNVPWMTILSVDSFYKPLTPEQSKLAFENNWDFDHPSSFDYDLLFECISDLKKGKAVEIPNYSFVHHNRMKEKTYLYGPNIVLLEGLFVLQDPAIRDLLDLKIFVQADSDLMLARRLLRDVKERGRDVEGILKQYLTFVKPSLDTFIKATMRYADIIVPGENNGVAINVISQHIRGELARRSSAEIRTALSQTVPTPKSDDLPVAQMQGLSISPWGIAAGAEAMSRAHSQDFPGQQGMFPPLDGRNEAHIGTADGESLNLPDTVHLLPQTSQLRGLMTIIHDETTEPGEYIFHVDRIARLVVEAAMSLLPYRSKTVKVSTGAEYVGKEIAAEHICAVSILRSGGVFEKSLRRAVPDMALGSLLIQSADDGEPFLYSVRLPPFIRSRSQAEKAFVFLADAQIGTGAAAFMAVRVLLDHGVQQDRIVMVVLLASAKGGVHALAKAFPRVRIVVAGIAPSLRRKRLPYKPESSSRNGSLDRQPTRICYALVPSPGHPSSRYYRS